MSETVRPVTLEELLAHRRWVRTVALRVARDTNDADDLEQDAWLAAIERPPRHGGSLRGWFGSVVRNLGRNSRRGADRRARHESSARADGAGRSAAEIVAEAEARQVLARAVLDLDEPYRSTVLFRWYEDLAAPVVAERMGVPVETVRTRLKRAKERLRAAMDDRFGGDRDAWVLLVAGGGGAGTGGGTPSATVASAGAMGGLAMGATAKWAAGVGIVVLLGILTLKMTEDQQQQSADTPRDTSVVDPQMTRHTTPASSTGEQAGSATAGAPSPAVPPPVDLARADRDTDLHGVVVRRDGTPVAGATVQVVTYPWLRTLPLKWEALFLATPGAATTSSSDGSFALRLRRGDVVAVRFTKSGLAPLELSLRQAGERVRAVMEPGVRLTVTVRKADGTPAGGVRLELLRLWNTGDGDPSLAIRGVTAVTGIAVFGDLPGACRVKVLCESWIGLGDMKPIDLPATGDTTFELTLPVGRTLRGRVTDADGGGAIAGARVGATFFLMPSTTTNADGTFVLDGWTGDAAYGDLCAVADGYARWAEIVGTRDTLDIALHRGFAVAGRLVGPDGAPVASACVTLISSEHVGNLQRLSAGDAACGADGRFRVAGLDRTKVHVMTAAGPGFGKLQRNVDPPGAAGDVDLGDVAVSAPRAIEGRVTNAAGDPCARVSVTLTARPARGTPESASYGGEEERRTDDLGRFRFPDLAAGDYDVRARAENAPEVEKLVRLPADRDVLDVTITVAATRAVVVHVVDDAGAPVAGVRVQLGGGNGRPPQGDSDAAGVVRLQVDDGAYDVHAIVPPWTSLAAARAFLLPRPVKLPPGGPADVTVVLREGGFVTGTVLGPDGDPVPRVQVTVEPDDRYEIVWTDDAGRFRQTLPRGSAFALVVTGRGLTKDRRTPVTLPIAGRVEGVVAGTNDVVIRCERPATGRTLSFRVTTPDGRPLAGASVTASGIGSAGTAKTDADGRAALRDLVARPHRVSVQATGEWLGPETTEVVPNGQEVALTMRATVKITGVVVLPDGRPLRNAAVWVCRGDAHLFGGAVDDKGDLTALVPAGETGPFTLRVQDWDKMNTGVYRGEKAGVQPGESGVRIVADH